MVPRAITHFYTFFSSFSYENSSLILIDAWKPGEKNNSKNNNGYNRLFSLITNQRTTTMITCSEQIVHVHNLTLPRFSFLTYFLTRTSYERNE